MKRYLRYQKRLANQALARLVAEEEPDPEEEEQKKTEQETAIEKPLLLNEIRLQTVLDALRQSGASRVIDLGCGEGKLLRELLKDKAYKEIVGVDVSYRSLEIASERLHLDTMPAKQKERIRLFQGSLMYRDKRFSGFDAAAVIEVIEHLDPPRWLHLSASSSNLPNLKWSSLRRLTLNTTFGFQPCPLASSATRIIASSGPGHNFRNGRRASQIASGTRSNFVRWELKTLTLGHPLRWESSRSEDIHP